MVGLSSYLAKQTTSRYSNSQPASDCSGCACPLVCFYDSKYLTICLAVEDIYGTGKIINRKSI